MIVTKTNKQKKKQNNNNSKQTNKQTNKQKPYDHDDDEKQLFLKVYPILPVHSGVARAFPGGRLAHPEGQNEDSLRKSKKNLIQI